MTPQDYPAAGVDIRLDGPLARITLNRPEVLNAQTPAMWRALAAIGESLDEQTRVVVVSGAGGSFSAGLDRSMLDPRDPGPDSILSLLALDDAALADVIDEYQQGMCFLRDPRFVSVAAVQGHAIGAGFQLALSCDLRIASIDARFCMKEAALGLVPDLTGTQPLVDCVGYARALEICATARTIGAEEALTLGLVNQVVEPDRLDAAVDALVAALTAPMPGVARELKPLLRAATGRTLDEQRRFERVAQVRRLRELARALSA